MDNLNKKENVAENNGFEYTYYAPTEAERLEIESIRNQYQNKKTVNDGKSKIDRIKMLDKKIKDTANAFAIAVGVLGTLIFGLGLTMVLEWGLFIYGIIVAIIGCPAIIGAYFVHAYVTKKMKAKYGEEIIELSNEILND